MSNSISYRDIQMGWDCARFLQATDQKIGEIENSNFFKRIWFRFTGKTGKIERDNQQAKTQMIMQTLSYMYDLQKQISVNRRSISALTVEVKNITNELSSLHYYELETRQKINEINDAVTQVLKQHDNRINNLEANVDILSWLVTLQERDLDKNLNSKVETLLLIISEYFSKKDDEFVLNDRFVVSSALKKVGISPQKEISIEEFITLVLKDLFENNNKTVFDNIAKLVENIDDEFIISEVSAPFYLSLFILKANLEKYIELIDSYHEFLAVPKYEAVLRFCLNDLMALFIDPKTKLSNLDLCFQFFEAIDLTKGLFAESLQQQQLDEQKKIDHDKNNRYAEIESIMNVSKTLKGLFNNILGSTSNLKKLNSDTSKYRYKNIYDSAFNFGNYLHLINVFYLNKNSNWNEEDLAIFKECMKKNSISIDKNSSSLIDFIRFCIIEITKSSENRRLFDNELLSQIPAQEIKYTRINNINTIFFSLVCIKNVLDKFLPSIEGNRDLFKCDISEVLLSIVKNILIKQQVILQEKINDDKIIIEILKSISLLRIDKESKYIDFDESKYAELTNEQINHLIKVKIN